MSLHIGIALVTFMCGVVANGLVHRYLLQTNRTTVDAKVPVSDTVPRFINVGSLLERDYHIYWYRTPTSDDPEEITLYGDFRSAQVTREHLESNAAPDGATLIERGYKVDEKGRGIGERVVTVFKDLKAVRISWTEGDIFWSVQAPSLELAREFEESEIVRSITMSNKRLQSMPLSPSR